jgi:hypothetical protein
MERLEALGAAGTDFAYLVSVNNEVIIDALQLPSAYYTVPI